MLSLRRRARSGGFTLVELMTVVGIVAVMGAIAMATVSGLGRGQNPAALARSLQLAMMSARTAAISDGFQHRLDCVPQSVGAYCLVERAGQPGMAAPTSWIQQSRIDAGGQATLWAVTAQTDVGAQSPAQVTGVHQYVTFHPDGSSDPTGRTVYVADQSGSNAANHYKVYVYAATGMARLVSQW